MSRCKKCPAQIEWVLTEAGKPMPINAEPDPKGNLVVVGVEHDGTRQVKVADLFTPADAVRYMPHWATCPKAEEFRR